MEMLFKEGAGLLLVVRVLGHHCCDDLCTIHHVLLTLGDDLGTNLFILSLRSANFVGGDLLSPRLDMKGGDAFVH
jgi:hypothetical protein